MSEEVVKWMMEINALRQQLAEVQHDYTKANESALKWRDLYSSEAHQRRTEAKLAQDKIEQLQMELQQLKSSESLSLTDDSQVLEKITTEVANISTVEQLKAKLIAVIQERDRALMALKSEKTKHQQTRKNLTTVLGDTVDKLAQHSRGNE